jgi:molybdopterin converting factor small subunit
LATPLGTNQSAAMAGNLPVPSEVDPQNIARQNVEQTSAEEQKTLAKVRRKIHEQKKREILELEERAMKQYISHFSVDQQRNVKKDKDVVINIPTLKVQSDALPEANSDIANMIDGAVSASLNNKFVAMSEKFESTITSRLDRIEAKFGKQFSSNDINASTSNTENSKDSTLDDFSNLHIPKVPIGVPPIHHIHTRTTIGASAGGGSTMAATNAMTPHTIVYSEPSSYVPNSSLQHVPNTLPNQTSTYGTPQPTINQAPHPGSASSRTALGTEGFRED